MPAQGAAPAFSERRRPRGGPPRFERGEPITARPTGILERSARWLGRRRVQVAALALGALMGVALVGGGLWLNSVHEAGNPPRTGSGPPRSIACRPVGRHPPESRHARRGAVQRCGRAALRTTHGRTETTSRRSAKPGSGRSATTPRVWRRGLRARPRACRWWPLSTTGRSVPTMSIAGRGFWAWRGTPTPTPGAGEPAIRRRGLIARPWPN